MTRGTDCHSRLHISPAGSVGASASQRCPPDTRTAMTKRCVGTRTARKSGAGIGYIIIRGCNPFIKEYSPVILKLKQLSVIF